MAEIQDLDPVDANNTGRWPENMQYRNVNDAGRADEGIFARWYRDIDGSVVASGSSNAFAVTSNRTISSLANNIGIMFTANHSITGAATLNLNGLGAKDIRRFNGQPLAAGDIISGQPVYVLFKTALDYWFMTTSPAAVTANTYTDYSEDSPASPAANVARVYGKDDGSGNTMLAFKDAAGFETSLRRAIKADMESIVAARSVSPDVQHYHPGHPKFWLKATVSGGTPTLQASYNVASISDTGTGILGVTIDNDFSSADYCCVATTERDTLSLSFADVQIVQVRNASQAAGSILLDCVHINTGSNTLTYHDPAAWHVIGLGDQ